MAVRVEYLGFLIFIRLTAKIKQEVIGMRAASYLFLGYVHKLLC